MTKDELLLQRRRKGLTQVELATAIGYSRQAVIKWERGFHSIPDEVAVRIIDACQENVPSRAEAKETAKQQRDRLAFEAGTIKRSVDCYRRMRAWPQGSNHLKAMAYLAREGTTIDPRAYAAIVKEFPDILTDPNGDYTVSPEQSRSIILDSTTNPEK